MNRRIQSIRESVATLHTHFDDVADRASRAIEEIEAGRHSKTYLQHGVSKREALAKYRGRFEVASRARDGLSMLLDEIEELLK